MRVYSRTLTKLQVIARNSDCFIALLAPVVIGQSNYFGIGLQSFENCSLLLTLMTKMFFTLKIFQKNYSRKVLTKTEEVTLMKMKLTTHLPVTS